MKKIFRIFAVLAAMTAFAACNKDLGPDMRDDSVNPSIITLSIPDGGLSRVSLEQDPDDPEGVIKLAWEEGDAITVKNADDESKSLDFALIDGAGTRTATFQATAAMSALSGATKYNVYLSSRIPGDLNKQTQASNGSTDHLGYAATLSGVGKYDGATFSQAWASSNGGSFASSALLRMMFLMPSKALAASVHKVTFKSDKNIFAGKDNLEISIAEPGAEDEVLTVYATLPASNVDIAAGTELMMQFYTGAKDYDKYTSYRELRSIKLQAGKVNAMNIDCSDVESFANGSTVNIGTANNPYLIGDRNQMLAMRNEMVAGKVVYFKMLDDVDLSGANWIPLNNEDPYTKSVNFNGGGHTIAHFSADGSLYDYPSFFGVLQGDVNDVTFDKASISCGSKKGGVICGYLGHSGNAVKGNCNKLIIKNSTIESKARTGAIAAQGALVGTISNCAVIKTKITSTDARVASFLGTVEKIDELSDSYAEDIHVESSSRYVGGLVGQLDGDGKILRCHTSGTVKSTLDGWARTGGLIAFLIGGTVKDCYSTATVTCAAQAVGGLIGDCQGGSVENCYYNGNASGNYYVGGLVGIMTGGSIKSCHASGKVSAAFKYSRSGGLIGLMENGSLSKCYSDVNIEGAGHYAGGLVGQIQKGTIEKSYCTGKVNLGEKYRAGGFIGCVDKISDSGEIKVSNCYTTSELIGAQWCGGFIGGTEESSATVSITNCFTNSEPVGNQPGALIGINGTASTITCSGFIGWWEEGGLVGNGSSEIAGTYYLGTEGTISSHATAFGWPSDIWNLSGSVPTLK